VYQIYELLAARDNSDFAAGTCIDGQFAKTLQLN